MGRWQRLRNLLSVNPNITFLSGLFILIVLLSFFLQVAYYSHFLNERMEEYVENAFRILQGKISDYIDLMETIYQIEFIPEFGELAESKGLLAELVDLLNDPSKRVKVLEIGLFYLGEPFLTWQFSSQDFDFKVCKPQRMMKRDFLIILRPLKVETKELCSLLTFDVSYRRNILMTHILFSGILGLASLLILLYLTYLTLKADQSRLLTLKKLQAERDLALLGRMASSFAHELRNSLNAIFLKLQSEGSSASDAPLLEELRKMLQWLEDILFFQKEIKVKAETFKTEDFALELKLFFAGLNKKGVALEVISKTEELLGDRFWLKKALENLLKNSYEAVGSDGLVRVFFRKEDQHFIISVYDNGKPLPLPSDKLFEPFFTTKKEGFGLGLYLVKKVVEAHGGDIMIESSSKGKTFNLSWKAH